MKRIFMAFMCLALVASCVTCAIISYQALTSSEPVGGKTTCVITAYWGLPMIVLGIIVYQRKKEAGIVWKDNPGVFLIITGGVWLLAWAMTAGYV